MTDNVTIITFSNALGTTVSFLGSDIPLPIASASMPDSSFMDIEIPASLCGVETLTGAFTYEKELIFDHPITFSVGACGNLNY